MQYGPIKRRIMNPESLRAETPLRLIAQALIELFDAEDSGLSPESTTIRMRETPGRNPRMMRRRDGA